MTTSDSLLIEMLNHAYEHGQSACVIGQIAKLHMSGYSPSAIIQQMESFSAELDELYSHRFRAKFVN